jgi:acyl-CoA synthetase (AMP-forming)/AMP-acid ligase II
MGSTCVIEEKFNSEMALKTIEKEKVTVCVAVPTIFWLMMVHPAFDSFDLSSLNRIIYGGAPASANYIKQINAKFPDAIQINAYGLTECTSLASALPHREALRKRGSIGLPTIGSEIKIVDENENEVTTNVVGELLIKSSQVCEGYWQNEKATKENFRDGWLYTKDLAKVDKEGFIYLMDRKKNMIIRGGENIYSIEVENVLYSNPKILEAAVVGAPDEIFGEQVKACIVLKANEEASEEEIRLHCNQYLADFKVPKYIEFYDELPRNPAGKVIKEKL